MPIVGVLLFLTFLAFGREIEAQENRERDESPGTQEYHYKAGTDSFTPSPTGALLRSMVIPGWGQVYNRRYFKAVMAIGLEGAYAYGVYTNHLKRSYYLHRDPALSAFYRDQRNRLTWYLAGTVLLMMLDAYVDAHLYHFEVLPP